MAESPKLTTNPIKLGHEEVAEGRAGELLMETVAMECGSLPSFYIPHPAALTRVNTPPEDTQRILVDTEESMSPDQTIHQ